jgi:sugar lactone lactonase YvrE
MTPTMLRRSLLSPVPGLVLAASLVLALQVSNLQAVGSQTWRQREKADFEKGEPKGVSLSADGALRISPRLDTLYESTQPYLWALAQDRNGLVYAAGGNEGKIFRIPPTGKGEVFFKADDPEVHALAIDASGNLYAGTSPGGRVYKIGPDGKKVWICETGEKYVWALALDGQGNVLAGTGVEGRILKIDGQGRSRVFYDSAETHIRALVLDDQGNLLAGTDGHGLVLRISPKGDGFVLYDAPLNEVAALVVGRGGTIYAATLGETGRAAPRPERVPAVPQPTPAGQGTQPSEGGQQAGQTSPSGQEAQAPPQVEQRIPIAMEGKVLAISKDGYGREVWSASQEAILSLAAAADGSLIMGSSQEGKIYSLDSGNEVSEVARLGSGQITAMLRRGAPGRGGAEPGDLWIAGSNFGTVSLLHSGHAQAGTFESRVLDAHSFADWGHVSWRADLPKGTSLEFSARSGNTEDPDRTWSDWIAVPGSAEEGRLACPPARFLQWRAALRTDDTSRTPALREVAVTYLQRNLPPEIRKIEIQAPGVSFQKVPAGPPGSPAEGRSQGADVEGAARRKARPQSRRGYDPDARSVSWQAVDPNDDDLVYDVYYRAIDEARWKSIRKEIDEDFVTLDGTALPDGTYVVRVVASDSPSNPPGQALTAEKTSAYFDVDNTPPRIEAIKAAVQGTTVRLDFAASDTFSVIRAVEYAIDAGEWVSALPTDGLNDSLRETYSLGIASLAAGEHSIVIRATDGAGNTGAGKAVITIP